MRSAFHVTRHAVSQPSRFREGQWLPANPICAVISVFAIMALLYLQIFQSVLPLHFMGDSHLTVDLVKQYHLVYDDEWESQSYLNAAAFFRLFFPISPYQIAFVVGAFYIYLFFLRCGDALSGVAAAAFLIPPLLLCLPFPQKDTISILGIAIVVFLVKKHHRPLHTFMVIFFIYVAIAVWIRPYYMLAWLLALLGWIIWRGGIELRIMVIGSIIVGMMCLAAGILGDGYLAPQLHRDLVNLHRISATAGGHRTAFNNPMTPDAFDNFLINYAYAVIVLNVPIVYIFDERSMLASIYICGCILLGIENFRKGGASAKIMSMLFFAHMAVLALFEPDIGSYLRHLSPLVIYLLPGLKLMRPGKSGSG